MSIRGGCSPTAGHPLARCTGYDPSTYVGGGCTQGCYACTWDTTSDPPNPYCKAVGGGTLFFCDPPPSPPAPLPMPSPPSHPGCNRSSIADRSILRDGYATELEPGSDLYCNAADQTCDFCEGLSEDDCLRSYVDPGGCSPTAGHPLARCTGYDPSTYVGGGCTQGCYACTWDTTSDPPNPYCKAVGGGTLFFCDPPPSPPAPLPMPSPPSHPGCNRSSIADRSILRDGYATELEPGSDLYCNAADQTCDFCEGLSEDDCLRSYVDPGGCSPTAGHPLARCTGYDPSTYVGGGCTQGCYACTWDTTSDPPNPYCKAVGGGTLFFCDPPPSPPAPLPMPSPPSHPGCNRSSIADRSILRDGYATELEPGSDLYCNAADQTCDFCEGLSEDDCLRSYVDPGGCSPTAGHPLARCTGYDPSTYVGGGCTQGCYACTWDTTSDPPNPYCKAVGGGTLFFCDPPPSPPAPLPMPSPPSHPGCNRSSIADRSILRDGYATELEPGSDLYCNAADQTCDFCEGLSEDDCLRSYVDPGGCSPTAGHPLARCTGYDPSTYVGGGCTQGCYACTWDTTSDLPNPYCKAVGGGTLFFCDPPPSPPAPLSMPSAPRPPSPPPMPRTKNNVLFFVMDDLRPDLNVAYGQTQVQSPHLDDFAAKVSHL